jgi:hypothetical protein
MSEACFNFRSRTVGGIVRDARYPSRAAAFCVADQLNARYGRDTIPMLPSSGSSGAKININAANFAC